MMMMMMMASESLKVLEFEGCRTQYLRCFEEAFWVSGDDGGGSSMSLSPPCLPLQILGGASAVA